ncbi:MAG: hypothetical protein ACI4UV_17255, partial [Victivallales bacterium]
MEVRWYHRQPWKFIVILVLLCAAPASGFIIFGLLMVMYQGDFFPPPIPQKYLEFDGYEKPELHKLKRRIRRRLRWADFWAWLAVLAFGSSWFAGIYVGKQFEPLEAFKYGFLTIGAFLTMAMIFIMFHVRLRGLIPYLIEEYEERINEPQYT